MIQKNELENHPLCDTVLKILYAGEDEEMDIDASGNLVIRAGGQEIVHKVDKEAILGFGHAADTENAEMQ